LPEATSEELKEAMQWFYDVAPNFYEPNDSHQALARLFGKVKSSSSTQSSLPRQFNNRESNMAWEIFCERKPRLG